jgi:plastocyanin/uncharacterized membrane protein
MRTLSTGRSETESQNRYGRREFIGLLGAGAAAGVGLSGTTKAQGSPVVAMDNTHFDPVGLHVEPGTTVRFEIAAGSHSATTYEDRIPKDAAPFDSGTISEGAFEHTFDTPGTYDYYCRPHQSMGMVGRIVVGEPGGPAEESPIPDGEVPESETIVEQGTVGIDEFGDSEGGDGEMKHGGAAMMSPGDMGWKLLMPVGFLTLVLSLVGAVSYWASRRGRANTTQQESPMDVLERQYARGEFDEEEFERRRAKLNNDEKDSGPGI